MGHDVYRVTQAPWRNTALPTMVWFIEGYAVLPLLLWLIDLRRVAVLGLALSLIVALTVVRYFGLDARAAYRLLSAFLIQALGGGRVRATATPWQRNQ